MRNIRVLLGRILRNLPCIALAFVMTGCYALGVYPQNTVKNVSDVLDTVPLGTPFRQMLSDPRMSKLNFQKPRSARRSPFVCLSINPFHKSYTGMYLFRQVPSGFLLEIADEDLGGEIAVAESIDQTGMVMVFLGKDYGFKGYFAYSLVAYSKDRERLQLEKDKFRELGLEEISERCRQWGKLIGGGPEREKGLPHLPLSQYMITSTNKNQK